LATGCDEVPAVVAVVRLRGCLVAESPTVGSGCKDESVAEEEAVCCRLAAGGRLDDFLVVGAVAVAETGCEEAVCCCLAALRVNLEDVG